MEWKKVVAIIRGDKLREVEQRLKDLQVNGISVTRGKGYGEYANFFSSDWCVMHARLEIYCEPSRADGIIQTIMDAAHSGSAGDGIVALIPVEKLYRIRSKAEAKHEEVQELSSSRGSVKMNRREDATAPDGTSSCYLSDSSSGSSGNSLETASLFGKPEYHS